MSWSRGNGMDYRSLGHGLGVRNELQITGSWSRGKGLHITGLWSRGNVMDYISLGYGLGVRHCHRDHWAMIMGYYMYNVIIRIAAVISIQYEMYIMIIRAAALISM